MPRLASVLETVLYFGAGEAEEMERFYGETLGLPRASDGAYRVGTGLVLLFERERAKAKTSPPRHGTDGAAHVGFLAADGEYEAWKERLAAARVPVIQELTWDSGNRS